MNAKTELVVIPVKEDPDHSIARNLVERGNVKRAVVMFDSGELAFDAWRTSESTYAWRTSIMAAPAFHFITADEREPIHGMPRWQWDLYGKRFDEPRKSAHK